MLCNAFFAVLLPLPGEIVPLTDEFSDTYFNSSSALRLVEVTSNFDNPSLLFILNEPDPLWIGAGELEEANFFTIILGEDLNVPYLLINGEDFFFVDILEGESYCNCRTLSFSICWLTYVTKSKIIFWGSSCW